MSMKQRIEQKLTQNLPVLHLEVINESHMHSVPPGSESHFKVLLVSDAFEGKRKVGRHQQVYGILAEEMQSGIHALALHTYTQAEWAELNGVVPAPPNCTVGSKQAGQSLRASFSRSIRSTLRSS